MRKNGITITTLAISIIIITILAGVVISSVSSTINFSKITTWANELRYIEDTVNEEVSKSSTTNVLKETITIDTSSLTQEQITNQFSGELIANSIVSLKEIDLGLLKINDTVYGNKNTPNDVYAYSETTGRVYYVEGMLINGVKYYTVANNLLEMFGIENSDSNLSTVVFEPSIIGYTNEPITVKVKIPNSFANVSITSSNNSIVVGNSTTNGNTYEYIVNTTNIAGNYTVTVTYTSDGSNKTSTYEVNGYDNTAPNLRVISKENNVCTLSATDNCGFSELKYIEGEIASEDIAEYFQNNGKKIANQKFTFSNDVEKYTIYSKDLAGNYNYIVMDNTKILVSFDANGGNVSTNQKYVNLDSNYGELPTPTKEGYTFVGWSYSGLPVEYQQVEYIESTGEQYIDTGVIGSVGQKLYLDMKFLNLSAEEQLMGKSWYDNGGFAIGYARNASTTQFLAQAGHTLIYGGTLDLNRHKYVLSIDTLNTATFIVDGISVSSDISFTESQYSLLLFVRRQKWYVYDNQFTGNLYSCKIFDAENLIRNFIPCYSTTTVIDVNGTQCAIGTIGLYDAVNNEFYTNQGTENFLKGDNVPYITNNSTVENNSDHTITAIWRANN